MGSPPMTYRFLVAGYLPLYLNNEFRDMKYQARVWSHCVLGNDIEVGPRMRVFRDKLWIVAKLNRREMVMGVGNFKGLASWLIADVPRGQPVWVEIDMCRARRLGVEDWIVDFVRQIIEYPEAGWQILEAGTED